MRVCGVCCDFAGTMVAVSLRLADPAAQGGRGRTAGEASEPEVAAGSDVSSSLCGASLAVSDGTGDSTWSTQRDLSGCGSIDASCSEDFDQTSRSKRPTIAGDDDLAALADGLARAAADAGWDSAGGARGGEVLRQGPLRHEQGWLRGSRSCWVHLRSNEIFILNPYASSGLTADLPIATSDSAFPPANIRMHGLMRRVPLSEVDALAVTGCRLRARMSDGSDVVLIGKTAAEVHGWKIAIQEARGSSPRRAFLQAALGDALAVRSKATSAEQIRWLCLAASWGETAEVGALLRAGTPASGASRGRGRTALHYAALNGHAAVSKAILAHRADPNLKDRDGISPLEAALEFGHAEVAHVLAQGGAQLTPRAEDLAMMGSSAARLLATLRTEQWHAAHRGGGSFLTGKQHARRQVEEQQRSLRAWREKLEISNPSFNRLGVDEYSLGRHCLEVGAYAPTLDPFRADSPVQMESTQDEVKSHFNLDRVGSQFDYAQIQIGTASPSSLTTDADNGVALESAVDALAVASPRKKISLVVGASSCAASGTGIGIGNGTRDGAPSLDIRSSGPTHGQLSATELSAKEAQRLCKQGVPPELRCLVWPMLLRRASFARSTLPRSMSCGLP
uniref:Uncharacterized protein n=1 Tax=Haptolina ericina TaxID=156174 RepID=A0A6T8ZFM7_9EUKA|mmetsp:Transcript_10674/g.24496  ORF Transcript_10674/g.24496 Transcript_10674/m.24496 type:complete len:621 (+) Transcript_10674:268-2130(+)